MVDQVTETPHTTVIERRGSGAGWLIALVLLVAVVVGGFYLYNQSANENVKTNAITQAASDVGAGAQKAGDAAQKAAE